MKSLRSRLPFALALALPAWLLLLLREPARASDVDPEPPTAWPKTAAADRARSAANLREIGLALHNYHAAMGALPANAIRDKNGKALLSWRVALLPYVEEDNLYKELRLDEPWDSKHNKKLLARMPKVYAPTVTGKFRKAGVTFYQAFTGPDTVFNPKAARGQGAATLGLRLLDIKDGTSMTALVVEGHDPVLWTKPDDIAYDVNKPIPKLGGLFKEGFHVLLADGDVRLLGRKVDGTNLRRLIEPNDGGTTDWEKLPAPASK